jgi:hypothetical protein
MQDVATKSMEQRMHETMILKRASKERRSSSKSKRTSSKSKRASGRARDEANEPTDPVRLAELDAAVDSVRSEEFE